ncbi:hypothetical protein [Xanthomonas nasturtii]|nr:hypothetical protein [Xanthomonas nasturtii]
MRQVPHRLVMLADRHRHRQTKQSGNQEIKQSRNQATKQPSNQATKQPSNQATKQSSNQAIKQSSNHFPGSTEACTQQTPAPARPHGTPAAIIAA